MWYKDKSKAQLLGVCAGLADKLNMNLSGVRITFVILIFLTNFIIFLVYIALSLLLKDRSDIANLAAQPDDDSFKVKSKAQKVLPLVEERFKQANRRLSQLENYVVSDRFSFQRQLRQKD